MQASYAAEFDREMGCTEAELLGWLPGASRGRPVALQAGAARVDIGQGSLQLRWQILPPRRIALITLPRLAISFRFDALSEAERHEFMRYFDLYTQRGGG